MATLGRFCRLRGRDRDPRAAAQAKRDSKQASVNRHDVLRSVGVATRCDGHFPAAEIDLPSPCKRDGATAQLARLSPDRRRLLPRAPQSGPLMRATDAKASAPYQRVPAILFRNASGLLDQLQNRFASLIELIRIFRRGAFGSPRKWDHIRFEVVTAIS